MLILYNFSKSKNLIFAFILKINQKMRSRFITILFIVFLAGSLYGQDMAEYTNGWEGTIENSKIFNFEIKIEGLQSGHSVFKISNSKNIICQPFKTKAGQQLKVLINHSLFFEGILSKNGSEINGFIKSGLLLYHLKLVKSKTNTFIGTWNILMVDELNSQSIFLSVENGSGDKYQAYPIFADDRFTGTWCANFQKEDDSISFSDFKTGLNFRGKLLPQKIILGIYLEKNLVTEIELKKSQTDWKRGGGHSKENGEGKSNLQFKVMESLILNDSLTNTHSVLISKNGALIYEKYFDGYNANIPHDMRSASKSISSAIVGIAKDKSLFKSVDQYIFEFLPENTRFIRTV